MTAVAFDTLKFVKKLKEAGMPEKQAEAQAEAFAEAVDMNLATKQDIKDLKRSFNVEIFNYKNKAIKEILDLHPSYFDPIVDFDDWKSAMKYLDNNKQFVIALLSQDQNDKKTS